MSDRDEAAHAGPRRGWWAGVAVVAALTAGAAIAVTGPPSAARAPASCTPPALSGQVLHITVLDMGWMSGGAMGGGTTGAVMPMHVRPTRLAARAGQISLQVANAGTLVHELLVMPLSAAARVGIRAAGPDRTVGEDGNLGEASGSCAASEGDGIAPGTAGWATLTLPAGRYELLCNRPGHYTAGMYAELDVT